MDEPMQASAPSLVLDWILAHIHILGWGFVISVTIKFVRFLTRLEDRFTKAETTLEVMAHNHLSHIQQSMVSVDENMRGMRNDLKNLRDDLKDFAIAIMNKQ